MISTANWWNGEINWATPAGELLQRFFATLPTDRPFHLTVYGSAALQLTLDQRLMSADVDLFSDGHEDIAALIELAKLGKAEGGLYIEAGYELSFRASPSWRARAATSQHGNVTLTIPHPLDILLSKLGRLEAKDLKAFERVIQITGHPTRDELLRELQASVDLFRPAFDEDSPNKTPDNTRRLWAEIFHAPIDVRKEIIEPAIALRNKGYGGSPPNYKRALDPL